MAKVNLIDETELFDVLEDDEESFDSFVDMNFDIDDDEEVEVEDEIEFEPVKPKSTMSNPANRPVRRSVTKAPVEEIEVEEKPVVKKEKPKSSSKQIKVETKQTPKAKAEAVKKGKVRVNPVKTANTYSELFEGVTEKVEKYNSIMKAREEGSSKAIPQSVVVSKDLLISLLAAKFTEEQESGLKQAMTKAMVSMGFDREEVVDAVSGYSFKKVEAEAIYTEVLNVFYDILAAGAGMPMFKTDDCNCSLKGSWTKPSLKDNAHLQTDKATYTESFLRITSACPAPSNKKTLGTINSKGKFVPESK